MRFHKRIETRLPAVQPFFEKSAAEHGFDWRLIAAQSYQESHFNIWARSHAGALGLMQLMPRTAKSLGVTDVNDPEQNVDAGVRHLKDMHKLFSSAEEPDRTYLALAAYNAGRGHLLDAKNLAQNLGMDPNKWTSLEKTLPLLEQEEYFKEASYGYCRGSETVKYLRQILIYYDILKHKSLAESEALPPE
ncbi:transglycosylase SLT domain-containing protein [Desulfococcaceae bacterium OttesenSCG-928-F15]|nr:transglycosylase SLT domain-containing protein [Desulfococcaceae bacterium OttesenSCG-928-F15]